MSTTQIALEILLHRKLVQDYSFTLYIAGYESEMAFDPPVNDLQPCGPPAVPPNTPNPSPLLSPPPTPPKTNGIH